jgi:hypothetical protein
VTTAKATLAAGDIAGFYTRLEGLNVQDLGWSNAASQKDAVLQFAFNGPAGTYTASISGGGGATFVMPFTISAGQALTDTLQTFKIAAPGATRVTWPTDNTIGVSLRINHAAGSNFLAPASGWNDSGLYGVTGMSNGLAAVQTFQVWDIYFGADPDKTGLAPPFEIEDYATTLVKCQRYWQQLFAVFSGNVSATLPYNGSAPYPVTPRATPTLAGVNYGNTNFPAAAGTLYSVSGVTFWESRTANGTGVGAYQTRVNVNARM